MVDRNHTGASNWRPKIVADQAQKLDYTTINADAVDYRFSDVMETDTDTPLSAIDYNEGKVYLNETESENLVTQSLDVLAESQAELYDLSVPLQAASRLEGLQSVVRSLERDGWDVECGNEEEMKELMERSPKDLRSSEEEESEYGLEQKPENRVRIREKMWLLDHPTKGSEFTKDRYNV